MNESPAGNIPIFYGCVPEATEVLPIEIAWGSVAFDPNESHGVVCESRLIRPPAAWTPKLRRNPYALQVYGLAVADLRQFGTPVYEIAARMNAALAEQELFSATVADDDRIKRIFDAAKTEPQFALRKCDAEDLIADLARAAATDAHRRSPRQTGSRGHVPYRPPRRSQGPLSRDLLALRCRRKLVAPLERLDSNSTTSPELQQTPLRHR